MCITIPIWHVSFKHCVISHLLHNWVFLSLGQGTDTDSVLANLLFSEERCIIQTRKRWLKMMKTEKDTARRARVDPAGCLNVVLGCQSFVLPFPLDCVSTSFTHIPFLMDCPDTFGRGSHHPHSRFACSVKLLRDSSSCNVLYCGHEIKSTFPTDLYNS